MRNFIRNIIKGLRGFIRNEAREPAQEPVAGATIPALDEPVPATAAEASHFARLTPLGIRFKGIRYYSSALADMLPRAKTRVRVEVRIKDPSDASSIFVWDDTARPAPRWITVPAVDIPAMSFAEHARLRDVARNKDLAFITEIERSKFRELLREHWEKLANQSPIRETPTSRNVEPWDAPFEDELALTADDVVDVEIDPLQTDSEQARPRGRKPSKPAIRKAKLAQHRKKAETIKTRKPRLPGKKSK